MSKALLFPGQGSQFVGMGKALNDSFTEAKEVFQEVDDALDQKLSTIIFEGPELDLTLTENTQPALMAVSMAVFRVLMKQGNFALQDIASYVAGHSLGEYSALCAAGAFSLSDTAKLLKIRGKSMQEAVPYGKGAMAALLGLDYEAAVKIADAAQKDDVCQAANDNAPGQVVVSGHKASVERAMTLAQAQGAKRAVLLPVSAPFHCRLMEPAALRMKDALDEVEVRDIQIPLIANVTASEIMKAEDIKKALVAQVTGTVRWRESILVLKEKGVDQVIELGAGRVLSGLVRRIEKEISALNACTPEEIEALISEL